MPPQPPSGPGLSEAPADPSPPADAFIIEQGTAYALFAYDIGLSINLDEAQSRIRESKQRETIKRTRRAPTYFEYQPAPLRVVHTVPRIPLGRFSTSPTVDAVLYDFGAVSVTYAIPLEGPLEHLLDLSNALYDNAELLRGSRSVVETLARSIGPAVTKPGPSNRVEDYVIYELESVRPAEDPERLVARDPLLLAQVLRAENVALSRQEVEDALACRISFGPQDLAIIDWNAAVLLDREADDLRAVLEFANVELLEMRFLDDQLDLALNRANEALAKYRGLTSSVLQTPGTDLRRIAELQMDAALLYENVNNTLKLLGDPYLARVARLASQRFHLNDWDASILRKLQTIESIYQKIGDRAATRRMELLEWIIIVLIAVSIVLPFATGK